MGELRSYEIEATAELTSEKLLGDIAVSDGRIDVARPVGAASVLRQLGRRPD
jgi:hypothetical protein